MATNSYVVASVDAAADDVVALTLEPVESGAVPPWEPGAHVDLVLGESLVRQYSLCGSPDDRSSLRIAVLREPGGRGGSRFVHERLRPGARVAIGGPRNRFPLAPARAYRFVAGGIGITPLLPMIRRVAAEGADWRLLYGGRTRSSMAFVDELVALGAAAPDAGRGARVGGRAGAVRAGAAGEGSTADRVEVRPADEGGLLPVAAFVADASPGTAVYCCGPEPLLRAVEDACAARPALTLHTERFAPRAEPVPSGAGAFEVELARSGRVLPVAADVSLLQVLEDAGVAIESSCREGTCGTCETTVLGGDPDHRDSLLTDDERAAGDVMFPCVSRARSARLILDV
nr:PDR/VanB family oxidoreductase [Cryptosporangium aurantiacum]